MIYPPPHYARAVTEYVQQTFPQPWFGRRGSIEWPPRSPDTNGFLFFGCSQEQDLWETSHTVNELKDYISDAFTEIDGDVNFCYSLRHSRRATKGGAFGAFSLREIFKTLHRNFDIWRNFQMLKLKFCILIIIKKILLICFLSYWLIISLQDAVYLETGHLIESFLNDWYLTTNTLKLGERLKCW